MEMRTILERLIAIKVLLEKEHLHHRKVYKDLCVLIEEIEDSLATL